MIMVIDPSSTTIGVAFFHDDGANYYTQTIAPDNDRAEAVERVHQMSRYLLEMIDEVEGEYSRVRIAIVESPLRHQGPKRNPGAQHAAYGVVYHVLREARVASIISVNPSEWTKNKPKETRQWRTRQKLGLSADQDGGGDAVDAYQLGRWWILRNPKRLAGVEERGGNVAI